MPAHPEQGAPLLRMEGISKRYGGIQAIEHGELVVQRVGEVHALMGTNGSGKSTMLKILSGEEHPDEGAVIIDGRRVHFGSAAGAVAAGVALVSQETAVVPHLSVAENVLMGRLRRGALGVDWRASARVAAEITESLGLDVPVNTPVAALRADQRQVVEIARAIATRARILILDEPTSSLADDRVDDLHTVIRRLAAGGVSVIFVSHRLDEVFQLADTVTVMRDGRHIETRPIGDYTVPSLVSAMTGAEGEPVRERVPTRAPNAAPGPTILEIEGLSGDTLREVSLSLHAGEIVGVAGLGGSGREELLAAVFGARKTSSGRVRFRGEELQGADPRNRIRAGIGYVPPDRANQGVVRPMSSTSNLVLPVTSSRPLLSSIRRRDESRRFEGRRRAFGIRAGDPEAPVSSLSGGNQQKIVLGKWFELDLGLLLLEEPTRGIDVGARHDIHERLRDVAANGLAMLVSSSETDELLTLCHRVVVLVGGRIIADRPVGELDENTLTGLIGGHL